MSPPLIVAAAVVFRDGRVLLTRRRRDAGHLAGYWEFPGGKLEPGEPPERAVVRECREECGVEVGVVDILDVTFHAYPGKDVLLLFYECRLERGEVKHLGVADHAWVGPAELDGFALPPADEPVARKIRSRLSSLAPGA